MISLDLAAREGIAANVRRWLAFHGHADGEPIELQALNVATGRGSYTESRVAYAFDGETITRLLVEYEAWSCPAAYFIANEVDPAVATRIQAGRWHPMQKGESTSDAEIASRRVLYVDVDAKRAKGTSATDAEVAKTHAVAELVYARFAAALGSSPLGLGDSGNGRAVLIALASLPSTLELTQLVKGLLAAIGELYGRPGEVVIDSVVCDPKRLLPAWGSMKRKGIAENAARPHRPTGLACADVVERIDAAALSRLLDGLLLELTDAQRAIVDKAMGKKPAAPPASSRATSSVGDRPFERANRCAIEEIASRLGLVDGDRPRCPGCGSSDSGVAFLNNGLKCSHARCAQKGRPAGFRTPIDLVAETQGIEPREAANVIAEWFGFDGFTPAQPPRDDEDVERDAIRDDSPPPPKPSVLKKLAAAAIFAALPPIPWLAQGLDLTAGAPAMFAGYGYSRKTIAAQALALAVASGRRAWGEFSCRRGRVLHLDYEQGERLSRERYQRLAVGLGIPYDDVEGYLDLVVLPALYLDSSAASDVLCREFEGYDLVIVDSFRASAPSADENASDVRRHLDVLTRASERTGAVPLVVHHARKPSKEHSGDGRMALRGSSAVFDACSSILVFTADKGEATLVQHEKARVSGVAGEDFYLDTVDVDRDGNPRAGLAVRYMPVEQVKAAKGPRPSRFNELKAALFTCIKEEREVRSLNALCAKVSGGQKQAKLEAMRELIQEGIVVSLGKGGPYRVKAA